MGTWAELLYNKKPVIGFKNQLDYDFITTIFRFSDFKRENRLLKDREDFHPSQWNISGDNKEMGRFFSTTSGSLKDRLEVLGYKRNNLEKEFHRFMNDSIIDKRDLDIDFLEKFALSDFELAIRKIILEDWDYDKIFEIMNSHRRFDSLYNYLISSDMYLLHTLPFTDKCFSLKLITESAPDDLLVVLDLTDLIEREYIDEDIYWELFGDKVVILTEGITDIEILRPSLKLLYPHLSEYYTFMDFKAVKAPGSASALVTTIKSFAGAGIGNRIIALFDNDTAAREALTALELVRIPKNIVMLQYPSIDLANSYPTVGPTGLSNLNVNGLAGSIELYTGRDILGSLEDELIPVQWKGYSSKLKAYQGELLYKKKIQEKFKEKLKKAEADPREIQNQDWSGIKAILQQIFHAF